MADTLRAKQDGELPSMHICQVSIKYRDGSENRTIVNILVPGGAISKPWLIKAIPAPIISTSGASGPDVASSTTLSPCAFVAKGCLQLSQVGKKVKFDQTDRLTSVERKNMLVSAT